MGAALQGDNKWVRRGRGVGDAASYAGSGGAVRGYYGLPHQCAHWFAMTFLAARCGRDDVGIVPYEKPVGRGQCAPPLRVRRISAAAHMGAALRRI